MGEVLEHSMRKVLSEAFPDKVATPKVALDPEKIIREKVYIPEDELSSLYISLAEFVSQDKELEFLRKALELDKKYMGESIDLTESYYLYAETLIEANQLDLAEQILQEGVEKFEGDTIMREILLRVLIKKQDLKRALKQLDLLLSDDSGILEDCIQVEDVYAPIRALPEYEKIVKKYQSPLE